MKVLVIGLGSMGKRRIRCLHRLGIKDVIGYDPRPDRRAEVEATYKIECLEGWEKASAAAADAWVISTPPDTHVDYALQAVDRGIAFFTEANVTDPRMPELIRRLDETGVVGVPSCTMVHFAGVMELRRLVREGAIGRPLTFTYQSGQYLPDWHPWESYKDFYVSKRETGACREIVPFELIWLVDVFGPVSAVSCMKGKLGDLDCDIDDVYQLLLRFGTGLIGHLMIDVVARPAVRLIRVHGTEGTVEWDHTANTVRLFRAEAGAWSVIDLGAGTVENGYIHPEEPYVREMDDFLAAVRKERPWPHGFKADEAVLDLLVRAENSDREGVVC